MTQCEAQTFQGISRESFACIVQKAESSVGIVLAGDSGEATAKGIAVTWNFDPEGKTLTIQCLQKPFFLPCSLIESQLNDLVNGCL